MLSLSAKEKSERRRGSDVFVRQRRLSSLTAANTLCKQAITGEKYSPTKWRVEGPIKIQTLCFSNSFALQKETTSSTPCFFFPKACSPLKTWSSVTRDARSVSRALTRNKTSELSMPGVHGAVGVPMCLCTCMQNMFTFFHKKLKLHTSHISPYHG